MIPENAVPLFGGTLLVSLLVAFVIFFVILYRKAQLQFKLERQEFQQALLQAEVEMREQTLTDISRDLHDNFGQVASLIKINLSMLSPADAEDDKTRLEESRSLLKQLISDIRSLSTSLNSNNLQKVGLLGMIKNDVERVNRSGFLEMDFRHEESDVDVDPEKSVFLYRIFQEILNNALKHSQATQAEVAVHSEKQNLILQVGDNGVGIPSEVLENARQGGKGNGLVNIKERCKMIGAECRIESSGNKGTFIEIILPTE